VHLLLFAARTRSGAVNCPHFYLLSAKNAERCANCTTFRMKGQIKMRGGLYSRNRNNRNDNA
ncbi:MAG: hypothetical protein IKI42_10140, partial [Clostridia bacterium]|nr:hypothetical protein [Clostridia bacterium]